MTKSVFKSDRKKARLISRNMLISWGIYAAVLFTLAFGYKLANFKMQGMNCFQDDLLTFALYILYFIPNKNMICDNMYVYPRLKSDNKVFLYYLKIYVKSSLVYFAGVNLLNLLYCLVMTEHVYMGALVLYVIYGYASFMILHLLSSVFLTKWNIRYISTITIFLIAITFVLNLIIPDFYLIGFIFYNMIAPGGEGYVPVLYVVLTYSVCIMLISLLWIVPDPKSFGRIRIKINLKKYVPLYLIAVPCISACFIYCNLADVYEVTSHSFFVNLLFYNYNYLIKYEMSNIEIQLIVMVAAILCLCIFFIISEKYSERKLFYMLAYRYKSREKLMRHTLKTAARTSFKILCSIFAVTLISSFLFGEGRIELDFRILLAYLLYCLKLYVNIYNLTVLISVILLSHNSGTCFLFAFIISFAVFITDIITQNIAIICLDYSLIHSLYGVLLTGLVSVINMIILRIRIYKVEI